MNPKLLTQGAEAKIYLLKEENKIIKSRIEKSYRNPILDKQMRNQRMKTEIKLFEKAKQAEVNVPEILEIDYDKFIINMEYIDGEKLSETLNQHSEKEQVLIMKAIAQEIAKLHSNNLIHGDLTTSNLILKNEANNCCCCSPIKNGNTKHSKGGYCDDKSQISGDKRTTTEQYKVYLIDFGLGFVSSKIEDKAVDIHLLKQALEAKHYINHKKLFAYFVKEYKHPEAKKVLKQLEVVEKRGRYK